MLPVLVMLGDAISLYGSYLGVNIRSTTRAFSLFWKQVFDILSISDVTTGLFQMLFLRICRWHHRLLQRIQQQQGY
ncbi:MAG: ABC transporter permease [Ferruginibacter sp.]